MKKRFYWKMCLIKTLLDKIHLRDKSWTKKKEYLVSFNLSMWWWCDSCF